MGSEPHIHSGSVSSVDRREAEMKRFAALAGALQRDRENPLWKKLPVLRPFISILSPSEVG
jgi:hypothetical protein